VITNGPLITGFSFFHSPAIASSSYLFPLSPRFFCAGCFAPLSRFGGCVRLLFLQPWNVVDLDGAECVRSFPPFRNSRRPRSAVPPSLPFHETYTPGPSRGRLKSSHFPREFLSICLPPSLPLGFRSQLPFSLTRFSGNPSRGSSSVFSVECPGSPSLLLFRKFWLLLPRHFSFFLVGGWGVFFGE